MKQRLIYSLLAALSLSLGGCGDGGNGDDASSEDLTDHGEVASEVSTESSGSAMDTIKAQAQGAMENASQAGHQAMEAISEAAGTAEDQTEMLGRRTETEIKTLIDEVNTYLDEHELGSAEDVMEKLVELKDGLPESMREQIDALEAKLDNLQGQE
ncbi:MAG: hypothetical protein VBE63_20070 [Lamprobacter sp.]|uniref:hypothetical protein n=1 Tax=Lamprobacter sp. TaxID=3100796 RepID=UPI002B260CB9|nr:hypothetical protein [Lamprobacter sp.]MEA3642215.1 hypothetical protein [Lamprobacter sp.]